MKQQGKSRSRSLDTRAKIVKGTLAAVIQNGIKETTTRAIAAAAGVSLSTLHYQFKSKDSILLALFENIESELVEVLRRDLHPKESLDQRVDKLLHKAWQYAKDTRTLQIVQYELTMYALRTSGGEWLANQQYTSYIKIYAGLLHHDIEPPLTWSSACRLSRLMLAGLDGLILQNITGMEDAERLDDIERLIKSIQLYGRTLSN